jgi:hypothetical protein
MKGANITQIFTLWKGPKFKLSSAATITTQRDEIYNNCSLLSITDLIAVSAGRSWIFGFRKQDIS